MPVKISVRFKAINAGGKMVGRASVTIIDELGFRLRSDGFRVILGPKGPWVAVPQERYWVGEEAKYKKLIDLNDVAEEQIFDEILKAYKESLKDSE